MTQQGQGYDLVPFYTKTTHDEPTYQYAKKKGETANNGGKEQGIGR